MITSTSLRHPMLRIRLDKAMREAAYASKQSGVGVAHASGIDVAHVRPCAKPSGFRFFDTHDRDITQTVLRALRSIGEMRP
jgi:hypothetical protein